MPLSENEELELLQLEEEEYQHSLNNSKSPQQMTIEEANAADLQIQSAENAAELQAGLAGAAQGSTFGFSDELGAAKDVTVDALSGKLDLGKWREYQKLREAENARLQEESPWAYGAGEVAGGIASSAVLPGVGAARIAATGRSLASPLVGRFLAGKAGGTAAKIAGKGVTGAIQGIVPGAAYGVGSSEADLSRPTELAADMASGAGMGSVAGLALTGSIASGKAAVGKAKELIDDRDFLRQIETAYDYGTKHLGFGSSSDRSKLKLIPGQRGEDLTARIFQVDEQLGKQVGKALDDATNAGTKINVDPSLQSAGLQMFDTLFVQNPTLGQLLDPKSAKLLKTIAERDLGDLSPIEARALKDELYNLSDKLAGFNSDQANFAKSLGNQLAGNINRTLKATIPEYELAAKQFEEFRRLVPETIISKGTPSKYNKVYMGDLKNPELKLQESSTEMLKKATLPGEAAMEEGATFEKLRRNLKELERKNPKAVQGLGGSADKVSSKLRTQADELAMIRQGMGHDPHENVRRSLTGMIVDTGRSKILGGANLAGQAATSAPAKASKKIFQASNDQLLKLAQAMKSSNSVGFSKIGANLETSLNNKSDWAKNAILFDLMQQPQYRQMLREQGLSEGDSNE